MNLIDAIGSNETTAMTKTFPFRVGHKYKTLAGGEVTCLQLNETTGYQTAQFDDFSEYGSGYRYNRPHDRGRCTAGEWDNQRNVIPISFKHAEDTMLNDFIEYWNHLPMDAGRRKKSPALYNFDKHYFVEFSVQQAWEDYVHGIRKMPLDDAKATVEKLFPEWKDTMRKAAELTALLTPLKDAIDRDKFWND